ncbi:MAG TPA: hypothetical protein PKY81_07445 [bacterium]|nr:hypothetical protein [bacterium]
MELKDYIEYAVKEFKKFWSDVYARNCVKKNSFADLRVHKFEAPTKTARQKISRDYYGLAHSKKMSELSDTEILTQLEIYLKPVIEFYMGEYEADDESLLKKINEIITNEYIIVCAKYADIENLKDANYFDENFLVENAISIDGIYDRWSEQIGGFNNSFVCIIIKPTGEDFTDFELDNFRKSILSDVKKNNLADYSGFDLYCERMPAEHNIIVIMIEGIEI